MKTHSEDGLKPASLDWLETIPIHWNESRLGFFCTVKARLGWKGLKAEEYVDDGYAFLSTPNLKDTEIDFQNVNFITEHRFLESPEIILQVGDVLVAKDGSTLGICNVVRRLPRPATVNSSIAVLRPDPKELDGVYLSYFFRSHFVQSTIQRMKDGMGVPHLFQADLRKFYIVIPPLPEQRAIAGFLDRKTAQIDAVVAKKQRLIERLAEKRQALISHAVTKGLDPHTPKKDSGIEWLGEIPAHWSCARTRLVARIESGHTPSRNHPEYWVECDVPWITLADVWQLRDGSQKFIYETKELVSELGLANSSARLLPKDTVILSRTASVGFSAIMGVPMATTQDFVNWVCGPRIVPTFLLWVFRGMKQEFERLMMG